MSFEDRSFARYVKLAEQPPVLGQENCDEEREWQRAYDDCLRALREIPDPAKFARSIEPHHRAALCAAWRSQDGWRVHPEHVRELRLLGLVEVGGSIRDGAANPSTRNHLGAFGMAVRRVLMGDSA